MSRLNKIFLSHARSDADFARSLTTKLCDAGYQVWSAAEKVTPGQNFASEIGKALDGSDAIVFLVSTDALRSEWFVAELEYALTNPHFKDRVFTVETKSTSEDQIPWILRDLYFVKAQTPASASRQLIKLFRGAAVEAKG